MALYVAKFGGSSVKDKEGLDRAARILAGERHKGNQVAAVVSAQGDLTDELIAKAAQLTGVPSPRELDQLLAAGEGISAALLAIRLEAIGIPAVSLLGWQAGILTDGQHGDAHILELEGSRVVQALAAGVVPVVAGFQGVDRLGEISTLGRGGSDTTAVALAARLRADECRIYTDVDGVYTADPRLDPEAVKLDRVSYDKMLAMARAGAQVLHDRSVLLARRCGVPIRVLSSFAPGEGTLVGDAES